jgi:hypothetical protein
MTFEPPGNSSTLPKHLSNVRAVACIIRDAVAPARASDLCWRMFCSGAPPLVAQGLRGASHAGVVAVRLGRCLFVLGGF